MSDAGNDAGDLAQEQQRELDREYKFMTQPQETKGSDEHIHKSDGSTANPSKLICKLCGDMYCYDDNQNKQISQFSVHPTTESAQLSDNRFGRFDEELIDRYFNDAGKQAIKEYVTSQVHAICEEALDRLEKVTARSDDTDDYEWYMSEAIKAERQHLTDLLAIRKGESL